MPDRVLELSRIQTKNDTKIPSVFPKNTHIAHFFRTKQDLLELLVPYFCEGLARREFCFWGVTTPLTVEEAKAALENRMPNIDSYVQSNQLEIFDIGALYGAGPFDAKAVLESWLKKVHACLLSGWSGFRCDGITSGVDAKNWKNLQVYEQE